MLRQLRANKNISRVILTAGTILACVAMYRESESILGFIENKSVMYLAFALTAAVLTTYIRALTNVAFIRHYLQAVRVRHLIQGYLISQIGKYVPGKVFGLISQSIHVEERKLSAGVIKASLHQFFCTNLYAVFFSIGLLLLIYDHSPYASLGTFMAGAAAFYGSFAVARRIPRYAVDYGLRTQSLIGLLLTCEWVFFIATIYYCLPDQNSLRDALGVSAIYCLSSIAGSLAFFIPSGLFVREAIFIWYVQGHGLDDGSLLALAIVLRVVLTLADLAAFLLYLGIPQFRGRQNRAA